MNHHLIGAETVQNAAYSMRESVEQFKLAVGWLDDALTKYARRQDEYLSRLEAIVNALPTETTEEQT